MDAESSKSSSGRHEPEKKAKELEIKLIQRIKKP